MDADVFHHRHRVVYADCTLGNHVYYARYLEMLEAARNEFFRSLGRPFLNWQERGLIFPVIECRLCYKAPARYDDVLEVAVWVSAAQKVRLNLAYRIQNQMGKLVLEAETFHVCAGLDERPKRMPVEITAALRPFVHAGEERSSG